MESHNVIDWQWLDPPLPNPCFIIFMWAAGTNIKRIFKRANVHVCADQTLQKVIKGSWAQQSDTGWTFDNRGKTNELMKDGKLP